MKKLIYRLALFWLQFWAKLVLRRVNPFIIGVTGSAGKSSAVTAIAPVLKLKFKNLKIAEKANSESGIPADILGLHFGQSPLPVLDWLRILLLAPLRAFPYPLSLIPYPFDAYLVEMGIDEPTPPKNMDYLLTIVKPDLAVILNALLVHSDQFGNQLNLTNQGDLVRAIAREKGKIITANSNLKFAVINSDDKNLVSLTPVSSAKVITFGKSSKADVKILSVIQSLSQTEVVLSFNKQEHRITLEDMVLPEFYGCTIAAAFATGICLGQNPIIVADKISAGFSLPPGRGRVFQGIKNTTIIDSSYNASRETMIGSLKMLQNVGSNKTKIAVLGDMRELGSQAKIEHQKVAEAAVKTADRLILVGPLMKQYALPIVKQSKLPVKWFPTAGPAAKFLSEGSLRGDELILVKGSQNTIFLEIVVEALLKNKSDIRQLCRRGKFWDKQRLNFK